MTPMKSLNRLPSWATWGLAFPLIVLNGGLLLLVLQYFQPIITVFVVATLLAFILNYPVQFLQQKGVRQGWAVLLVIFVALLLLGILGITLAPIAFRQLDDLASRLPSWIDSGSQQLQSLNDWAVAQKLPIDFSGLATQLTERFSTQLRSLIGQVLGVVLGTVSKVLYLILTLVLTFYLLWSGEQIWDGIYQWFPSSLASQVRQLLRQNFNNYYIGQASLAAIMGTSMTVAFLLLQIPFGLLFGLGVGFMALFPFGTPLSVCLVSLLMALKSFWLGVKVLVVATVIEQIIENAVAPRLIGGFTGLNPVWVIVALLVAAKVGGILGLLIAVPIAGFIKSLANFWRTNTASNSTSETEVKVGTEETV